MITADDLFKQKVQSYGFERKIYHATCTELMVFIHEGATPLYFNRDNGDGTYSHTVRFHGKHFTANTAQQLSAL